MGPLPWGEIAPLFAKRIAELAAQGFKGPFAAADGRPVHAAGGSEAQELAFALASAVAYLKALEASSIALDAARRMIFFRLVADADQFLTMAKFRALRQLWARVEEACGLAPAPAFVSAETAWRMLTRRDPWVNMLRTTVATFAAGIGGANAITALPFTAALGLPDRLARRIARNAQLVLLEESNLAKVSDPVAGAGGIEDLTTQLCRAAWTLFQEIETAGGAAAALERGLIQQKVAAVRAEREKAVATRKDALTGTSEFPHLAETPVSVLDVPPVAPPPLSAPVTVEPLRPMRLAEPFERLRETSDRALAETGARPKVFLANLGAPADFIARAAFAKNLFEAGGIEAVTNEGLANADALTAAFKASGAKLACLCSTDAVYAREAEAAATALAAAGAAHIYLAGRPRDMERPLREAGVQSFIYAGCDVLATLQAAHAILGVRMSSLHGPSRFLQRRMARAQIGRLGDTIGTLAHARRHPDKAGLRPRRRRRPRFPRHLSGHRALPARPLPDHVRHPAVDGPAICGLLHGGRFQRVLPAQSRGRPERPVDRLRSRHPPRLRFRTTRASPATSAWRAWRSTRSTTCARCLPASRSTA